MKPKTLPLLEQCIDDGIKIGMTRAYKHTDSPDKGYVEQCIYDAITNELHTWFEFELDK